MQVNDAATAANSAGEQLSKRCVTLLKMALKPDVWPNCELKLAWFDRLFQTVDNPVTAASAAATAAAATAAATAASAQPNYTNICTALELLTFLLSILRKEQILAGFKPLQRGLASLMNCTNAKVTYSTVTVLLEEEKVLLEEEKVLLEERKENNI